MNKLARIALAVALLAANGIAATKASAARGISIANFGHSFGGGRYFPPEPTLAAVHHSWNGPQRIGGCKNGSCASPVRRHARVIPAHPPAVNGYNGPNGPTCYTVSFHSAPNCELAGGTLGGGYVANGVHVLPYCVICN